MRSIVFTLLLLITITSVSAQEKIAEFTTSHSTITGQGLNVGTNSLMGQAMKVETKFEFYKDSLIMTQLNKRAVKYLEKKGLPISMTYAHPFVKEQNVYGVQYTFRNETEDFLIITESKASKPSVKIRKKDTFNDQVLQSLYYSN